MSGLDTGSLRFALLDHRFHIALHYYTAAYNQRDGDSSGNIGFAVGGSRVGPTAGRVAVRCLACGHRCLVRPGGAAFAGCASTARAAARALGIRGRAAGRPDGEKALLPSPAGRTALTFGMLGCDFHCAFCQNWVSSQALRDPVSERMGLSIPARRPEEMARRPRAPARSRGLFLQRAADHQRMGVGHLPPGPGARD